MTKDLEELSISYNCKIIRGKRGEADYTLKWLITPLANYGKDWLSYQESRKPKNSLFVCEGFSDEEFEKLLDELEKKLEKAEEKIYDPTEIRDHVISDAINIIKERRIELMCSRGIFFVYSRKKDLHFSVSLFDGDRFRATCTCEGVLMCCHIFAALKSLRIAAEKQKFNIPSIQKLLKRNKTGARKPGTKKNPSLDKKRKREVFKKLQKYFYFCE